MGFADPGSASNNTGDDILLPASVFDELRRQLGGFAVGDPSAGDVAAEDVQDDRDDKQTISPAF